MVASASINIYAKIKLVYKINRMNLLFMTFFLSALHISPFLLFCHKITCNNNAHPYSPSKYGNIEIIVFLCCGWFCCFLTTTPYLLHRLSFNSCAVNSVNNNKPQLKKMTKLY